MKLRINDECEVEIDWGAQTVMVRRAEAQCVAPSYSFTPCSEYAKAQNLVVDGKEMVDFYVWDYGEESAETRYGFGVLRFPTRAEAEAEVIARYEADHA